ncbi:MAG: Asp-tRNA(Asn)/Glu-tRNA(Gln) amidotransferase subunit GatB [Candidatus Omnitrophica bacterium]|nr:Asp-tRNA(Asn)/Glu-tRNA(Gln) amidotransferase subunit GatB [Candidatus Omnitrophota bacterium]
MSIYDKYEAVIGLEVHVQLATKTKIFCGCSTKFGQIPNSATCPVCLGLPGTLPVFNKEVFMLGIKAALAINCQIQEIVKFDRKNYYYPDLPKAYQISQYDKPLAYKGYIDIVTNDNPKRINITRAHLEEDAGKLLHDQHPSATVVDYNRTGTPLLEIVSEPEINTPEEAYQYLSTLKNILRYVGVSDCNMEEGSLRCDANVSVRLYGETKLGTKRELKNMNSFKAVRAAVEYEITDQIDTIEDGEKILQETRLWDADKQISRSMRSKEEAHDYKYFPEPDLVPFHITVQQIEEIKSKMPELPQARKNRFIKDYNITESDADFLLSEKIYADYFEETVKEGADPKLVYNWLSGDIMSEINDQKISLEEYNFTAKMLAELIELINSNVISGKMAKEILKESAKEGFTPKAIVEKKGLKQISNEGELENIITQVLNSNKKSVTDYKSGKENALGYLVGQIMKETKGKANPGIVNKLLRERLL